MRRSVIAVLALCACSEKKQEAKQDQPAPPSSPPKAQPRAVEPPALPPPSQPQPPPTREGKNPRGEGSADVKMSGALEKSLVGAKAVCAQTVLPGNDKPQGMSIRVDAGDFTLTISAVTDEELRDPRMILNINKPTPKSYAKPVRKGIIQFDKDSRATIDVELKSAVDGETVHVKGTIQCQPT